MSLTCGEQNHQPVGKKQKWTLKSWFWSYNLCWGTGEASLDLYTKI